MIPKAALALVPILWIEVATILPELPPEYLAGQIEQESCVTVTHPKCWNPRAELKTSREQGIGLGQTTRAWRADGTLRFDNFEESRRKYRELKDWQGDRIYDPRLQMRAMLLMDRDGCRAAAFARDGLNLAAMCFVVYNSGKSGLLQDRQLCRNTPGCEPDLWFDNIERQSLKSRVRAAGYGKSFFEISREYPRKVIFERAPKYREIRHG
jgi:hypothetical protein